MHTYTRVTHTHTYTHTHNELLKKLLASERTFLFLFVCSINSIVFLAKHHILLAIWFHTDRCFELNGVGRHVHDSVPVRRIPKHCFRLYVGTRPPAIILTNVHAVRVGCLFQTAEYPMMILPRAANMQTWLDSFIFEQSSLSGNLSLVPCLMVWTILHCHVDDGKIKQTGSKACQRSSGSVPRQFSKESNLVASSSALHPRTHARFLDHFASV